MSGGTYRHVVVGGGAAGCVVAARLSEDPAVSVLLLEAGPRDDHPLIAKPADAFALQTAAPVLTEDTVPQQALNGRKVAYKSGRVLGGGGSVNMLAWYRGHPHDYDGWRDAGLPGWGWSDVLPTLIAMETHQLGATSLHGSAGPTAVVRADRGAALTTAFVKAGLAAGIPYNQDFNGRILDGIGPLYTNVRDQRRDSSARAYLRPARNRPNLDIRTNAMVHQVVLEGHCAVGVRYCDPAGVIHEVQARSVVLCAGALRTPQLLLLSGLGPRAHLEEMGVAVTVALSGVGAALQDHLSVPVVWPLPAPAEATTDGILDQAGAFLRVRPGATAPDIQLTTFCRDSVAGNGYGFSAIVTLGDPRSRGTVRLRSVNPAEPPVVDPRYLATADDLEVLTEGVRRTIEIGELEPFRPLVGNPLTVDKEYVRAKCFTINHPAGTARAGTGPESVVDSRLRVRGVTGLVVADASVMPRITRCNTYAPTLLIAERAASYLNAPDP